MVFIYSNISDKRKLSNAHMNHLNIKENAKKITCKECRGKCCIGYLSSRLVNADFRININKNIKRMNIDGISLVRLNKLVWKCEWFNRRTGKCTNYKHRPDICKYWYCPEHKKQNTKRYQQTSIYALSFDSRYLTKKRIVVE
jgi:Fe-S-cluster containining protein